MSQKTEDRSYEWSTLYEERSPKPNATSSSTIKLSKIIIVLAAAAILVFRLGLQHVTSPEEALAILQTNQGMALSGIFLLLLIFSLTPFERILLRKDDVTFLKRIPNDDELSFRHLLIEHKEAEKKIVLHILYSVGPRITSDDYKKSISTLRSLASEPSGAHQAWLHEMKLQYPPRAEEELKLVIDDKFVHAMGLIFTLDQIMDKFDSDEIHNLENKHLALLLQLVFYGRREDMRQYLSLLHEADASNERHLSEKLRLTFLHFAVKYNFNPKI